MERIFPDTNPHHMTGNFNSLAGVNLTEVRATIIGGFAQLQIEKGSSTPYDRRIVRAFIEEGLSPALLRRYCRMRQITQVLLIWQPDQMSYIIRLLGDKL